MSTPITIANALEMLVYFDGEILDKIPEFNGDTTQQPGTHIFVIETTSTIEGVGVRGTNGNRDAVCIILLHMSLRGRALQWFEDLDHSTTTWDELKRSFVAEFRLIPSIADAPNGMKFTDAYRLYHEHPLVASIAEVIPKFGGHDYQNPTSHIRHIELMSKVRSEFKYSDVLFLMVFHNSLEGRAQEWYLYTCTGSMNWDAIKKKLVADFSNDRRPANTPARKYVQHLLNQERREVAPRQYYEELHHQPSKDQVSAKVKDTLFRVDSLTAELAKCVCCGPNSGASIAELTSQTPMPHPSTFPQPSMLPKPSNQCLAATKTIQKKKKAETMQKLLDCMEEMLAKQDDQAKVIKEIKDDVHFLYDELDSVLHFPRFAVGDGGNAVEEEEEEDEDDEEDPIEDDNEDDDDGHDDGGDEGMPNVGADEDMYGDNEDEEDPNEYIEESDQESGDNHSNVTDDDEGNSRRSYSPPASPYYPYDDAELAEGWEDNLDMETAFANED